MMKALPIYFVFLLSMGLSLAAPTDKTFEKILDHYFEIQATLAMDSTEGITSAGRSIHQLASSLQTDDPVIEGLASNLSRAAQEIQGKDLEGARLSFFELSKPLLQYLHQFYKGENEYFRYFCSMAKKGWIQPEKGTRNPYHGSSMLTCGELIQ